MSIILQSDTYKIQISRKMGLGMMIFSGLSLLMIIISNIYWITSYNPKIIGSLVEAKGLVATPENMLAYVKYRALFSIISNTLVSGLFLALVWWSIAKKRFGVGFGIWWMLVFVGNGISMPFYSVQIDVFAIAMAVCSVISGGVMFVWFASLVAYRQRLREAIARKGKFHG